MAVPVLEKNKRYTVQEYLAFDAQATEKHEYDQGEILAMSGGTFAHSQVALNFGAELRGALKGKPCQALESNIKVRMQEAGKYVYPDVTVVCGPPEFDLDDAKRTAIVNPTVIVEVLSESTEGDDRGKKFEAYRTLASLKEYVLVSQWEPHVETYLCHDDGRWTIRSFVGKEAALRLESLGITIPMHEIYLNVEFQPEPAPVEE